MIAIVLFGCGVVAVAWCAWSAWQVWREAISIDEFSKRHPGVCPDCGSRGAHRCDR